MIIKRRERGVTSERMHDFSYVGDHALGFSFPVNEAGEVVIDNDDAQKNYDLALKRVADGLMYDDGIVVHEWCYVEPAIFRCVCGLEFPLWGDEQCECGRMYNIFGQQLAYIDEAGFEAAGGYLLAGERWDEE